MKIFNKNEWKKVKLGDICDLRNGVAIKSEDYILNSNTLNCRMSNIRPDGTFDILYNAKYLPDNFSEKYKNYLLKNGDLVIAMTDMAGDPKILGVPTVVKSNGFNIIQNQRVGKLELLTDNIDENYLKFALQSKNVKNYFKKFSAGGVQLNLSKKEILNAPIVLPTIEEQKILVNLFKTIESFIYLRKKELLNLNSLNKSLFTKFNKNGIEKQLNDVADIIMGQSPSSQSYNKDKKGLPFYQGKTEFSDIYIKDPTVYCNSPIKVVEENDILMSVRAPVGDVNIATQKSCIGRGLASIKPKKIDYLYLFYLLKEQKSKIEKIGVGSTFKAINKNNISTLKISIVEKDKQNKIRNYLSSIEKLKFIFGRPLISTTLKNSYKRVNA